jgi:hypothetical protein
MSEIKITAAQQEQSKTDKERTRDTLGLLKSKKRKTSELAISINDEPITLKFQAISSTELDKLRAKHPPTKAQQANGAGINFDTFQPALVAMTLTDPVMTEDEVREMWSSDYWSSGELSQIFEAASEVCLAGLDVPPSASA